MKLGVNIDHVATLRQQRKGFMPDPFMAALAAQKGGADGIVMHLREDRRHAQDQDIVSLSNVIPSDLLSIPFSLEMAATEEMKIMARRLARRVCLVPERRAELT